MEILAAHPAGLTMSEMADRAGLTRAGARRFLLTLVAAGYARQDGRIFRLSPRLISLGAQMALRRFAVDLCRALHARGLADVERIAARQRYWRTRTWSMSRASPARASSASRFMSARACRPTAHRWAGYSCRGCPTADLDAFLARAAILAKTDRTVTNPPNSPASSPRRAKTATPSSTRNSRSACARIAVPIRDRTGAIVAAINVSTQSARMPLSEMEREFLPLLKKAAGSIEDFFVVQ